MTNKLVGSIGDGKELIGTLKPKQTLLGGIEKGSLSDYDRLLNKPLINSVELRGNKTFDELGLIECSNQDIEDMFRL